MQYLKYNLPVIVIFMLQFLFRSFLSFIASVCETTLMKAVFSPDLQTAEGNSTQGVLNTNQWGASLPIANLITSKLLMSQQTSINKLKIAYDLDKNLIIVCTIIVAELECTIFFFFEQLGNVSSPTWSCSFTVKHKHLLEINSKIRFSTSCTWCLPAEGMCTALITGQFFCTKYVTPFFPVYKYTSCVSLAGLQLNFSRHASRFWLRVALHADDKCSRTKRKPCSSFRFCCLALLGGITMRQVLLPLSSCTLWMTM